MAYKLTVVRTLFHQANTLCSSVVDHSTQINSEVFLMYGSTTVAFGGSSPDWACMSVLSGIRT